jgi:hypothetical protein
MPRIKCRTPSSEEPVSIRIASLGTAWNTVAEAPDYSVPETTNNTELYPNRDPDEPTLRAIRAGEIFLLTPLKVRNNSASVSTAVEARILDENGAAFLMERIEVPPNESVQILVQGLSLLKRVPANTNGDRLQVRAVTAGLLHVVGAGQRRPADENIGEVAP